MTPAARDSRFPPADDLPDLDRIACCRCGHRGVTIIVLGLTERARGCTRHARVDGWPFLARKRTPFRERLEAAR